MQDTGQQTGIIDMLLATTRTETKLMGEAPNINLDTSQQSIHKTKCIDQEK